MRKKYLSYLICNVTFLFLFSGCASEISSALYSSGCLSISYDGYEYNYLTNWEMISDNYTTKNIKQDSVDLTIRTYEDDKRKEFLFCENNASLYHKDNYALPEIELKNIDYLTFHVLDSNIETKISDNDTIVEFTKIFSSKSQSGVEFSKNIFTIIVNYKDFPAIHYCGNIGIDKNNNYWFYYDYFDNGFVEKFYPIDNNSKLLSFIKS